MISEVNDLQIHCRWTKLTRALDGMCMQFFRIFILLVQEQFFIVFLIIFKALEKKPTSMLCCTIRCLSNATRILQRRWTYVFFLFVEFFKFSFYSNRSFERRLFFKKKKRFFDIFRRKVRSLPRWWAPWSQQSTTEGRLNQLTSDLIDWCDFLRNPLQFN